MLSAPRHVASVTTIIQYVSLTHCFGFLANYTFINLMSCLFSNKKGAMINRLFTNLAHSHPFMSKSSPSSSQTDASARLPHFGSTRRQVIERNM